jgi:hypothetical protein
MIGGSKKMTLRRKLKAAEAVKEFASALAEESWCLDVSGTNKPAALHALSNRSACAEAFAYEFKTWAGQNGIEITGTSKDFWKTLSFQVAQELPRIYGSTFRPVDEKFLLCDGIRLANIYVPFRPEPFEDGEGRAMVDELFERLFPDPLERTTVLQFFAHIIQKPLERPQWGLLITGEGGTGKTRLVELAEMALGNRHRWRENDYKLISKQFSEILPNNLLVTFDDATATAQTYEDLKHSMTKSRQEVEIKGQQKKISREVYARIVILSNSERPLQIEDDRRFFVPSPCTHRVDREESAAFFERFSEWLGGPQASPFLFHYFSGVDLRDFNPNRTVRTKTLLRMEGVTDGAQLKELAGELAGKLEIFHELEIADHIRRHGVDATSKQLCQALCKAGFVQRRRLHPCGKGQLQLWCPATMRRTRSLTDDENRRILARISRR